MKEDGRKGGCEREEEPALFINGNDPVERGPGIEIWLRHVAFRRNKDLLQNYYKRNLRIKSPIQRRVDEEDALPRHVIPFLRKFGIVLATLFERQQASSRQTPSKDPFIQSFIHLIHKSAP